MFITNIDTKVTLEALLHKEVQIPKVIKYFNLFSLL